ncbi:YitT family protein [Halobacillus rhizosphaerae]|uniref:YczE/YyaS/YitT family protein n=1 Tax=Halobacillus rhizosphaerae TaxID=3064889 RepID=UPI00398A81A0
MKRFYQRALYYSVGIVVLTLGIALTIHSHLGTSPFDALLVGLYRTFGLTIGSWEIVVGLSMILFNSIADRRLPEIIALATSFMTGAGIDLWVYTTGSFIHPEGLASQLAYLLLGMIFAGLGIAINLQADFAPNPFDRTMLVVTKLTGWNVSISRAVISIILVIAAFLFGGAIGIGTLLITVFSGTIIQLFMRVVKRFDKRINGSASTSKTSA